MHFRVDNDRLAKLVKIAGINPNKCGHCRAALLERARADGIPLLNALFSPRS